MPVIIKVVITVTIHKAQQRVQDFSQVRNAFVSTVNAQTKQEAIRYDLGANYSIEIASIMAELYSKTVTDVTMLFPN